MKIRKAELNDLVSIQKLNNGLFEFEQKYDLDCYVPNWATGEISAKYFADLIENQFAIVAEEDNVIVGYLVGSIYNDDTYSYYEGVTAELENMFIIDKYRKHGVGSKLINSFIDWCKKSCVKRIFVTATIGNTNAIKFYNACGFKELNITLKKEL